MGAEDEGMDMAHLAASALDRNELLIEVLREAMRAAGLDPNGDVHELPQRVRELREQADRPPCGGSGEVPEHLRPKRPRLSVVDEE